MLEAFAWRKRACIVLPLYGMTLYEVLRTHSLLPLSPVHVSEISWQLTDALTCKHSTHALCFVCLWHITIVIHDKGVMHADLKPNNIIFISSECIALTALSDGKWNTKVSFLFGSSVFRVLRNPFVDISEKCSAKDH